MTRLKNILRFAGLVGGVPVVVPHFLNWNGRAVIPDIASLDESGYTVTADTVNLTITRTFGPAAVNVLVESWHSIERAFGAVQTLVLNPQPIVIQGDGASSAASSSQVFRYVANGTETDTIVIGAVQGFTARASANYNVQVTQGDFSTSIKGVAAPPALYLNTGFTLKLTAAPKLNDSFLFTVEDLT